MINGNPMRKALDALAEHPRCGAHCRTTGAPCKGPAMANGRCRMHGGKSTGAPSGSAHPNYRHGRRTRAAIEERRESRAVLSSVLAIINSVG